MKHRLLFLALGLVFSLGCAALTGASQQPTPISIESTPFPDGVAEMFEGDAVRLLVISQRYSIEPSSFLFYEKTNNGVILSDDKEDENFVIGFFTDENASNTPLPEVLEQYLDSISDGGITPEQFTEVEINGYSGVRLNFESTESEGSVQGSAVAVQSGEQWVLVAIGMANTTENKQMWLEQGLPQFEQTLATVKFLDTEAHCPVSTDETYGYTAENPIKVGGAMFGGASRERAYLDHLRDAEGRLIDYERSGSSDFGDVVLDLYVVTATSGEEIILYVDMYNFTEPKAPRGFTCKGAFPLSAP